MKCIAIDYRLIILWLGLGMSPSQQENLRQEDEAILFVSTCSLFSFVIHDGIHIICWAKSTFQSFAYRRPSETRELKWVQHDKTDNMVCAPSEHSGQPGRSVKTQIRLGEFPGWSESSLGTQVILLVLSWCSWNQLVAKQKVLHSFVFLLLLKSSRTRSRHEIHHPDFPVFFGSSAKVVCLSPTHYTPGIYAEGHIVFVFLFVRTYVCSYFRPIRGITSKFYMQATRVEYISPTTHQKAFIFGP